MYTGRYYHTLETNGRLSLPKPYREQNDEWMVTRGLDGSLFVFTADNFMSELKKLDQKAFTKKVHRDFIRLMSNEAKLLTPDQQGRVHLPEYLIEYADLKKQIVIVGSWSRIEIWDRDRYHHYIDQLEDKAEEIAEQLETTHEQQ